MVFQNEFTRQQIITFIFASINLVWKYQRVFGYSIIINQDTMKC
jgi:hypothetical protein